MQQLRDTTMKGISSGIAMERYRQMGIIRKSSDEIENVINENIERRCKNEEW